MLKSDWVRVQALLSCTASVLQPHGEAGISSGWGFQAVPLAQLLPKPGHSDLGQLRTAGRVWQG